MRDKPSELAGLDLKRPFNEPKTEVDREMVEETCRLVLEGKSGKYKDGWDYFRDEAFKNGPKNYPKMVVLENFDPEFTRGAKDCRRFVTAFYSNVTVLV